MHPVVILISPIGSLEQPSWVMFGFVSEEADLRRFRFLQLMFIMKMQEGFLLLQTSICGAYRLFPEPVLWGACCTQELSSGPYFQSKTLLFGCKKGALLGVGGLEMVSDPPLRHVAELDTH